MEEEADPAERQVGARVDDEKGTAVEQEALEHLLVEVVGEREAHPHLVIDSARTRDRSSGRA